MLIIVKLMGVTALLTQGLAEPAVAANIPQPSLPLNNPPGGGGEGGLQNSYSKLAASFPITASLPIESTTSFSEEEEESRFDLNSLNGVNGFTIIETPLGEQRGHNPVSVYDIGIAFAGLAVVLLFWRYPEGYGPGANPESIMGRLVRCLWPPPEAAPAANNAAQADEAAVAQPPRGLGATAG